MTVVAKTRRNAGSKEVNEPTPEKIRELTARIRAEWTPRERRRRSGLVRCVELLEMPLQPRRKGFWGE
jgi:hypothetical protein